jgi:hypothetical protein
MQGCDYKHCLAGVGVLAAMLYMAPSYGVLLSISVVVVLAFALGVALIGTCIFTCEQSANEIVDISRKARSVGVKTTVPGR